VGFLLFDFPYAQAKSLQPVNPTARMAVLGLESFSTEPDAFLNKKLDRVAAPN
jgi:hypothetical protein